MNILPLKKPRRESEVWVWQPEIYIKKNVVLAIDTTKRKNDTIVSELERVKKLLVYPNPTTDIFTVKLGLRDIGTVSIFAVTGKEVETHNVKGGEVSFTTAEIPSGTYIVRFVRPWDHAVLYSRFVIIH